MPLNKLRLNLFCPIKSHFVQYKTSKNEKFHAISSPLIPFNQGDLISRLDANKHKTLLEFVERFEGLCELICNRILIDNLLGNGHNRNSLKDRVTVERINEENIIKSHILDNYSIFCKVFAYLFAVYPNNIFSYSDQWNLVKSSTLNREMLKQGLENIAEGETLKLEVFSKVCLSLMGHSLLIKKMPKGQYIFFDPNTGEHRGLSFVQLSNDIDKQLQLWNGTDILLIRGKDYLQRLGIKA